LIKGDWSSDVCSSDLLVLMSCFTGGIDAQQIAGRWLFRAASKYGPQFL
jgi:hypothetical protein